MGCKFFMVLNPNPDEIFPLNLAILVAVLDWLVEVCLDDGDPITRQIPSSPGKKNHLATRIAFKCLSEVSFWAEMLFLLSGRWKEDSKGGKVLHPGSRRPILQFVSIKRKDCGQWAIPGVCCFEIFCIPSYISWVLFVQCEHVCEVTMKCLSWRGWLIQGSKSLSRCSGSSQKRP